MPVKIQNLTNELVLVRCNSGVTLHLAPRTESKEIMDVEVIQNPSVQKLLDRHVVALHKEEKEGRSVAATSEVKKEKTESTKYKK
ncbi:MAG: hypothetical protein ABSE41_06355 [Bacteroidota bacterium]